MDEACHLQRKILDWVIKYLPGLGLENRAEGFVQMFDNHLPRESNILDIGGGWGFYKEPLEKRGHFLTVLDIVKPSLQMAPVIVYDPNDSFPFEDKIFDVSLLITVLHHTSDPESVIREAKRVTKHYLILVEDLYHHYPGRLWTQLRDQIFNFEYFRHPCQFRKKDEWLNSFTREGFELVDYKEVYTWLLGLRILNGVFVFTVPD